MTANQCNRPLNQLSVYPVYVVDFASSILSLLLTHPATNVTPSVLFGTIIHNYGMPL
jgi:hypothetical protein